jgi:N-acetylglutamate synthase-like GNAT family acetyltransferase
MKMDLENGYLKSMPETKFQLRIAEKPHWTVYDNFCDYTPSFMDTLPMLKNNMKNESFIEVYDNDKIIGFLIFNKRMGRIENLGVDKKYRGAGVGASMVKKMHQICRNKQVYVLNVNEKSYGMISFFLRIGFKNDLDQFELKLNLPSKI